MSKKYNSPHRASAAAPTGEDAPAPNSAAAPSRAPHQNADAEQGLLASILLEGAEIIRACREGGLTEKDFYDSRHRQIYAAMLALDSAGVAVDQISICEELHKAQQLEAIGGAAFISALANRIEVAVGWTNWLKIVREKSVLRLIERSAFRALELARSPEDNANPAALAERIETGFAEIARGAVPEGSKELLAPTVRRVKGKFIAWLENEEPDDESEAGVTFGIRELDVKFGELSADNGDFLVSFLGASSHGKSAFARQMIGQNIIRGKRVACFTLETSKEQLVKRLAGMYARFDVSLMQRRRADGTKYTPQRFKDELATEIRGGKLPERDKETRIRMENDKFDHNAVCFQEWLDYLEAFADRSLYCYENLGRLDEIRAKIREIHRAGKLDFVVVDYLQLVKARRTAGQRGDEIIAEIVSEFKALAKQLGTMIILISSITEKPSEETPDFTAARGSQEIAYGSDRAIIVHRPANEKNEKRRRYGIPVITRIKQAKARDFGVWEETVLFYGKFAYFYALMGLGKRGRPTGERNGQGRIAIGSMPPGAEDWPDDPMKKWMHVFGENSIEEKLLFDCDASGNAHHDEDPDAPTTDAAPKGGKPDDDENPFG
jgi:replicative DNA helicase